MSVLSKMTRFRFSLSPDPHAFYSALIAVFLTIWFFFLRMGFNENSISDIYPTLALSFFILFFPQFLHSFFPNLSPANVSIVFSKPAFFLIGILGITFAGYFQKQVHFPFIFLFIALGAILFFLNLLAWLRQTPRWIIGSILFLLVIFSSFLAGFIWGGNGINPLFIERLLIGMPSMDIPFHAAISQMIQTHNIPSTGLDGLPLVHYHYGSHWWFAQLSNLLSIQPLRFYQLGYPVICLPIFFYALLMVAEKAKLFLELETATPHSSSEQLKQWIIIAVLLIGIFPPPLLRFIQPDNFMLFSESYVIGISVTLIFLSFLFCFLEKFKSRTIQWGDWCLAFFLGPSLMIALGAAKICLPFILYGVFLYLVIRTPLRKSLLVWVFLLVCLIPLFIAHGFFSIETNLNLHFEKKPLISFFRPLQSVHVFLSYFWSGFFVFKRFKADSLKTFKDLKKAWNEKRILDIEALLFLCLFGTLLERLGIPYAFYFTGTQLHLALALLLTWSGVIWGPIEIGPFKKTCSNLKIGSSLLGGLVLFSLITNIGLVIQELNHQNISIRTRILSSSGIINKLGNPGTSRTLKPLESALEKTKNFTLIRTLRDLNNLDPQIKKTTALFIPSSNFLFWNLSSFCQMTPFFAPSLSGIPMISGLNPEQCREYKYFCFNIYNADEIGAFRKEADDKKLCERAREKGFSSVIVIDGKNDTIVQRFLNCLPKKNCPLK